MDVQKEREAFEAWYKDHHHKQIGSFDGEYYTNGYEHTLWVGWQAAQKVAVPEGFVLVELNDLTTVLSNCSDAMMDESTSSVYDETREPSTWFDHHVAAEGNLLLAIGKAQEPSHD